MGRRKTKNGVRLVDGELIATGLLPPPPPLTRKPSLKSVNSARTNLEAALRQISVVNKMRLHRRRNAPLARCFAMFGLVLATALNHRNNSTYADDSRDDQATQASNSIQKPQDKDNQESAPEQTALEQEEMERRCNDGRYSS